MKKHIYIIRHGQTDFNLNGVVQGSGVNSSLNETGRAQAAAFYEMYKDVPFAVVITSKLKRTQETAQPFIERGIPHEQLAEINEISWGIHEGKRGTEADRAEYAQLMESWQAGLFDQRIEGGESAAEMRIRMVEFKNHLLRRPEEYILVVSHGRAMRCMMTVLLNRPLSEMDNFKHSNTGLYQFELENGEFAAVKMNDRSHCVG